MWHMKGDTQGLMNIVSKYQVPSFYGLGVKVSWKLWTEEGGKGRVSDLIN